MRHPSAWKRWLSVGPVAGGATLFFASPLLYVLTYATSDEGFAGGALITVVASVIGVVGGTLTGCIGAAIVWALDYICGEHRRAKIDAFVGATVAGALSASILLVLAPTGGVPAREAVFFWAHVPIVTAAAAWLGADIRRSVSEPRASSSANTTSRGRADG